MSTQVPHDDSAADDPERVLWTTRQRFIEAFPGRAASFVLLGEAAVRLGKSAPLDSLRRLAHQMSGLAGTIGFPTVSARSADVEQLVRPVERTGIDGEALRAAIDALKAAFVADLKRPVPDWAVAPLDASAGELVMVVEDEVTQRLVVSAALRRAGYRVIAIADGAAAVETASAQRPAVILLDIELPGMDGYAICRKLKVSPELSAIPVAFMTARTGLDDRLTGLALGADDYLNKPIDPHELSLRVQRLLRRRTERATDVAAPIAGALTLEAVALAAEEMLQRESGSIALVKVSPAAQAAAVAHVVANLGPRDLVGCYDAHHLVLLLPGIAPPAACDRLRAMADALPAGALTSGVAGATVPGATTWEALLVDADEALTGARSRGELVAVKSERTPATAGRPRLVLLADDDPDIMRILDALMRAAGYETIIASDGTAALSAATHRAPDLIVLDLMMPKLSGFDVLQALATLPGDRPRTLVLSGRGRQEDVTRAFQFGADDYVTKPLNPQELMGRVARLLK